MEKIKINGVKFNDFGENTYSDGMRCISLYPMPEGMVEDVLAGKYPGVYLNPSAPCTKEFFGVYGTSEQYEQLYSHQKECCIAARVMKLINWDFSNPRYEEIAHQVKIEYKDWWKE